MWQILARLIAAGSLVLECMSFPPAFAAEVERQTCSPSLLQSIAGFAQQSGVGKFEASTMIASACKVWPKDNNITLVASVIERDQGRFLLVVMWNNLNATGIAANSGIIPLDEGCRIDHPLLAIDTARYDVIHGARAFGVDIADEQGVICRDTGLIRLRNLYLLQQQVLKPVMEGFYLTMLRDKEIPLETGSGPQAISQGEAKKITLKIALEKTRSHDFADLKIFSVSNPVEETAEPFHFDLKYDGNSYPLNDLKRDYLEWLGKHD